MFTQATAENDFVTISEKLNPITLSGIITLLFALNIRSLVISSLFGVISTSFITNCCPINNSLFILTPPYATNVDPLVKLVHEFVFVIIIFELLFSSY